MTHTHLVQYYETDAMGITHHSNYIRWMEEARVDMLIKGGCDYAGLEKMGLGIPVLGVQVAYKRPTRFQETVAIEVRLVEYDSIRMKLNYVMHYPGDDTVLCTGTTEHCFVNAAGRPTSVRRSHPEVHAAFLALLGRDA